MKSIISSITEVQGQDGSEMVCTGEALGSVPAPTGPTAPESSIIGVEPLDGSSLAYQRMPIVQGTAAWHEWRRHGIGASDAASIMGENPYKRVARVMAEKLGTAKPTPITYRMEEGLALEPVVRRAYNRARATPVQPACLQSRQVSWLRASADGLSADGQQLIEIKCGWCAYRHLRDTGSPTPYYRAQLQHLLAVTELPSIDYVCYVPGADPLCRTIERDDAYIAVMLCRENAFWERVLLRRGVEE